MTFRHACSTLKREHRKQPLTFWQGVCITLLIVLAHQYFLAWVVK